MFGINLRIYKISNMLLLLIALYLIANVQTLCFPRNDWPVERRTLFFPNLDNIAQVLGKHLKAQFHYVRSEVISCPDLREEPYKMAARGMTGSTRVLDIGGLANVIPPAKLDKSYSLVDMISVAELNRAFAYGAGAGPFQQLGYNSEGIYNFNVKNCRLDQHSVVARLANSSDPNSGYSILKLNDTDSDVGLVGNLFASKGLPGKVIRLHLKQRLNESFVLSDGIRRILHKHFGVEKPIALGLLGLFQAGVAKTSIMPDFTKKAVPVFADWVHYFNTSAPFIMVGTIVAEDQGLHLYTPHIHVRSEHQGGHFYNDITPDLVEYDILLNPAEYIYRVDKTSK